MKPVKKSKINFSAAIITVCGILFSVSSVNALERKAQLKLGQMEYLRSCASCHGKDAKGGGPVAAALTIKPSDLTMISKKFNGKFPEDYIYKVINGRDIINPHGDTDMPVWGDRYIVKALKDADAIAYPLHDVDAQAVAFGRITLLVGYLESIQAK
jgi:mono/diheme cytochrome c family protein